ncbi:hypothetical protein pb186bvf_010908 [Paramecium bursaria]
MIIQNIKSLKIYKQNFRSSQQFLQSTKHMAFSPLQLEILKFYRQMLKFANTKVGPSRDSLLVYIKGEFRKNQEIPKRQFRRIEYLLRQGQNRYAILKDGNIDQIR